MDLWIAQPTTAIIKNPLWNSMGFFLRYKIRKEGQEALKKMEVRLGHCYVRTRYCVLDILICCNKTTVWPWGRLRKTFGCHSCNQGVNCCKASLTETSCFVTWTFHTVRCNKDKKQQKHHNTLWVKWVNSPKNYGTLYRLQAIKMTETLGIEFTLRVCRKTGNWYPVKEIVRHGLISKTRIPNIPCASLIVIIHFTAFGA